MSKSLITINEQPIGKKDIMGGISQVLLDLNKTNDPDKAIGVLNSLDQLDNVTGHAKAFLLWGLERWHKVHKPDEHFPDFVADRSTIHRNTVERYVNVWTQIDEERIPKRLQERPMRELVPIAKMLSQGFEPTAKEWTKIELAANSGELGDVIRDIKGKKARKSALTITMDREGNLYCYRGEKRVFIGYLDQTVTDEDAIKAQQRILDGAGIVRK